MVRDLLGVLLLRLHRMPYDWFYGLWWKLLPLCCHNRKLGGLRLWNIVPIRTGLGTMAVLVGSVVAVIILWNYVCDELGTWKGLVL